MTADHALWAALPIPAFLVRADGQIVDANPAAEAFFNASRKGLIRAELWNLVQTESQYAQAWAQLHQNGRSFIVSDAVISNLSCTVYCAPMMGNETPALVTITPENEGLRTPSHNTEKAARSAIGMADMLAHEIKNPLAGISGAAQLLAMNLSAQDRELTDLIVGETRRIVSLLEQVERFGDQSPPTRSGVNLHDILDRARKSAEVGFASHMQFSDDYDPSLPLAFVDGDQMQQVFLNLLKNAAEASPKGGVITLRTFYDAAFRVRQTDGFYAQLPLHIEVRDDGPGLPPDIAADVFSPFVSGHENGTGLGLALVSKLVRDNGGWISVDSTPRKTKFQLSLPRFIEGS